MRHCKVKLSDTSDRVKVAVAMLYKDKNYENMAWRWHVAFERGP